MSDANKATLKKAKSDAANGLANTLFSSVVPTKTFAGGIRVETNANAIARFPLPLTIGGAVTIALGALAMMRKHRVIGLLLLAGGGAAIGAAAAAPEINAALKRAGLPS